MGILGTLDVDLVSSIFLVLVTVCVSYLLLTIENLYWDSLSLCITFRVVGNAYTLLIVVNWKLDTEIHYGCA